jgi:hypothetical protein
MTVSITPVSFYRVSRRAFLRTAAGTAYVLNTLHGLDWQLKHETTDCVLSLDSNQDPRLTGGTIEVSRTLLDVGQPCRMVLSRPLNQVFVVSLCATVCGVWPRFVAPKGRRQGLFHRISRFVSVSFRTPGRRPATVPMEKRRWSPWAHCSETATGCSSIPPDTTRDGFWKESFP